MFQSHRIGELLRRLADRIDYAGAPKILGTSFTFEEGTGQVFRSDGRGCRLAYLGGEAEYSRAHDEAGMPRTDDPLRTVWLPVRNRPRAGA
jgi:hypothetical protein